MQLTEKLLNPPSLSCILLISLFLTLLTFYPFPLLTTTTTTTPTTITKPTCDLFRGRWVPTNSTTLYNNRTCGTLPSSKNCLLHGRPDDEFLRWRWAPEGGCDFLGFDALGFLGVVKGKTVAFVGDSVARNQVDSLVCMVAPVEVPVVVYKDAKDRSRTWYFPKHNFTLMMLWTRFLVKHKERGLNGSPTGTFDLHIDQLDETWATHFEPNRPPIHYAIISDSQWFFRQNLLYENEKLLGCTYCNDTKSTKELTPIFAIRMALRASLGHIMGNSSRGVVTLVRTISPSHFEGGTWKTGGFCERRRPFESEELVGKGSGELELGVRKAQVEEVERVRREGQLGFGVVEVLDVTWAMLMRPDGHPGEYWRDKRNKGYSDCVHWCLPGPIDTWNELLWALLRRLSS